MIAGIDYSTHAVDVVLLDEGTDRATWHRFELAKHGTSFDRARSVRQALPGGILNIDTMVSWDDVVACGIEEPRGYGSGSLYRIQGAILACLPQWLLVQPWVPSAWRKQVGLPGNASKRDIQLFADGHRVDYALWGGHGKPYKQPPMWPQDALDAYCIALATRQQLHRTEVA